MDSYHKKKIGSIPKDSTGGSSIRKGMVVFNGGTSETGLVGDVTGNCVSVPVRMTAGRELVTDDAVMFLNDCREASAEQKIALQRLLNEGHLAWDKRRGVCSESLYAPKDGHPWGFCQGRGAAGEIPEGIPQRPCSPECQCR